MYLPAIVSVGYYFEKRRSFAMGLAVCGSGIGTFIFAPLSEILVHEYGWKGATLIEAGIILNCILCGALFRPLIATSTDEEKEANVKIEADEKEALMKVGESNGVPDIQITPDTPIVNKNIDKLQVETRAAHFAKSDGALHIVDGKLSTASKTATFHRQTSIQSHNVPHHPGPMYRKDIFYSGSLLNIPQYKSNPDLYVTSVTSLPDVIPDKDDWALFRCLNLSPEMRDAIRQMLDFSLLKDVVFLLFVVSNFCTSIGFNMPYIFLPDRAEEAGISKENAAFLVAVIGIANTVGRVIFGWMADRPGVNRLMLYNTALVICGIGTALSPLSDSYAYLVCYAAVFGAFIGRLM